MKSNLNRLLISIGVGFGLTVAILILFDPGYWLTAKASPARAANLIRYVAPGGTDGSNVCTDSQTPCATVQRAADVALPDDEIRVAAGTYASVSNRSGVTQTL